MNGRKKKERELERGCNWATPSMWAPGRPVAFILREMRKHEKILSKEVKFTDITGCFFEKRSFRVKFRHWQGKSRSWATK